MDAAEFEMVLPPESLRPFVRRYMHANRRFDAPLDVRPKPTGYTYFSNFFAGRGHGCRGGISPARSLIIRS